MVPGVPPAQSFLILIANRRKGNDSLERGLSQMRLDGGLGLGSSGLGSEQFTPRRGPRAKGPGRLVWVELQTLCGPAGALQVPCSLAPPVTEAESSGCSPKSYPPWGRTPGGPGIRGCTKLPGDLGLPISAWGLAKTPSLSGSIFSEESTVQGGEASAQSSLLDGAREHPLASYSPRAPSALSPEAVKQHSGMMTPQSLWDRMNSLPHFLPLPIPKPMVLPVTAV